jgi:SHS2 domain-containing protein
VGGFRLLEHTADIGLEAEGATLEEVFEQATIGLADIIGIRSSGPADTVEVEVAARDIGGLLVDWLSEFLWLHESRAAALASVAVQEVTTERAAGHLGLTPMRDASGIQVKAITYHQLTVEKRAAGWRATVFFDV